MAPPRKTAAERYVGISPVAPDLAVEGGRGLAEGGFEEGAAEQLPVGGAQTNEFVEVDFRGSCCKVHRLFVSGSGVRGLYDGRMLGVPVFLLFPGFLVSFFPGLAVLGL